MSDSIEIRDSTLRDGAQAEASPARSSTNCSSPAAFDQLASIIEGGWSTHQSQGSSARCQIRLRAWSPLAAPAGPTPGRRDLNTPCRPRTQRAYLGHPACSGAAHLAGGEPASSRTRYLSGGQGRGSSNAEHFDGKPTPRPADLLVVQRRGGQACDNNGTLSTEWTYPASRGPASPLASTPTTTPAWGSQQRGGSGTGEQVKGYQWLWRALGNANLCTLIHPRTEAGQTYHRPRNW